MRSQKVTIWILVLLLLGACGAAYYFYRASQTAQNSAQVAAAQNQAQIKDLVAKVGKLIVLPQGEDPTVATVVNPDILKNQPFFANAKKGDLVLIYTNAKKAILYSPTTNKIVEVAPITIGNPAPVTTSPAAPASSTK